MGYAYEEFDWYETPLFYDIVFADGTKDDCDFLEALYERHAPTKRRRILEPACGSGRLVREMARRGYRVTGFDISPGSVEFARNSLVGGSPGGADGAHAVRIPPARVLQADMASFRSRHRYDLAHCLISSFQHLKSERAALAHLRAMAAVLTKGGIYALAFHVCRYDHQSMERERNIGQRGDLHVVCNVQIWPAQQRRRRQKMRSRLIVRNGQNVSRYQTSWEFRTYDDQQFRRLLAKVPEFEHLATYDYDYDCARPPIYELGSDRLDQVVILRRR